MNLNNLNVCASPELATCLPMPGTDGTDDDSLRNAAGLQDLPIEILERILDCMLDDKPSLSVCSRLSRSWTILSRPRLFQSVRALTNRADGFADFLESSPHLAELIVSINFSSRPLRLVMNGYRTEVGPGSALIRALSSLPALQELRFTCLWFNLPYPPDSNAIHRYPGPLKVQRLVMDRCWVGDRSASAFLSVLTLFEADALDIFDPRFKSRGPLEHISIRRPLVFRTLVLGPLDDPAGYTMLLDGLRQTLLPGSTRSISVTCSTWDHILHCGGLMRTACSNLEHLRLDIFNMLLEGEQQREWHVLNLSSCPNLQTLDFGIPFGVYRGIFVGHLASAALAAILTEISLTLRAVTVQLIRLGEAEPYDLSDAVDFHAIERVLNRRDFFNLETFTMQIPEWENAEDYRPTVEQLLPSLHNRGLLRWDTAPSE